jgi:tRNA pseudouridine(55) synthase
MEILMKNVGETPLECVERFRSLNPKYADLPITYAGRLDPMASGKLLVLVGEECKNKEAYLGLDKEYEVEVLFGVETDTQDILGVIGRVEASEPGTIDLQKYIGKFTQPYPAYSSKTVAGKQLHTHARDGTLPDAREMPTREVEIYSIEEMAGNAGQTQINEITGAEIAREAIIRVSKVTGDFRQKEIIEGWSNFAEKYAAVVFKIIKIRVACSGGTYMRSLAERIGRDAGIGAIAYSIHRTKIGQY